MVLVVVILAVPLSRTDPRQGRFTKLLPAIVLYFTYLLALNALRGNIESGELSASITLLPIHIVFLLFGLWLLKPKKLVKSTATAFDLLEDAETVDEELSS